jgi:hypothetical protein
MLTREQILKADDLRHVDVDVPEWGGVLRLRTITAKDRQKFHAGNQKGVMVDFQERFIVACAVDEKGDNLFTEDDLKALSGKSSNALNRVFEAAVELNGMSQRGVEDIEGE